MGEGFRDVPACFGGLCTTVGSLESPELDSESGCCGVSPLEGVMEDRFAGCNQGKSFPFLWKKILNFPA